MGVFKILEYRRRGVTYEYVIKGEKDDWGVLDLVPHFLTISKRSTNFSFSYRFGSGGPFYFVDKRSPESDKAEIRTRATLDKKIKRVNIFDSGIGKQMIEKFMASIEREPAPPVDPKDFNKG